MHENKLYIGAKMIKAFPMSAKDYEFETKGTADNESEDQPGYRVEYPGGYVSWSPKRAFELAYREVTKEEKEFIS